MGEAFRLTHPASRDSRFMIGRDAQGHWVVCDVKGLVGGIFFDRSAAIHFAVAESGYAPGAVCCAPDDAVLTMDPLFKPVPVRRWPQGVHTP
ncbi:MAG: hypothetical protein JWR51_4612 [Devosia sp.]|nr:hypothetical protein [Devosia sp.]